MKTAKMTLKIILALTLPLNAMAFGTSDSKQEMSIDAKLELQSLKLYRAQLQRKLAKSVVTIQALKDIADPGLLAYYREHDESILINSSLGALGTTLVGMFVAGVKHIQAAIKGAKIGIAVGGSLAALAVLAMVTDDDYAYIKSRLLNSSSEERQASYILYSRIIVANSQQLEILDQQIEALEQ